MNVYFVSWVTELGGFGNGVVRNYDLTTEAEITRLADDLNTMHKVMCVITFFTKIQE